MEQGWQINFDIAFDHNNFDNLCNKVWRLILRPKMTAVRMMHVARAVS